MSRADTYRTRAIELLSQAKELSERAQRYLRLADQAEREPAPLVSAAQSLVPEQFDFLSFLTDVPRPSGA